MKNIYSDTQESHNCWFVHMSSSCQDFTAAIEVGWEDHFTLWKSLCATCKDQKNNVTVGINIKKTRAHAFFTSEHLHSGLVHAGSQTALLCNPPLCWISSWRGLRTAPDAPLCVHSVQTPHILLWLFLEGPVRQNNMTYSWKWWNCTSVSTKIHQEHLILIAKLKKWEMAKNSL